MAEKYEKAERYGSTVPAQPGGPSPQPGPSRSQCAAPPRLGPAKPGGNPPRKGMNPYGGKR